MIIRISTEGQYELPESSVAALNELDNQAVAACQEADEDSFHAAYGRMLEFVREKGRPVDEDHLGGSDLILPPPDVSLEEAQEEFTGDGLIPE
ncbi:MAG TPA: hypothetical protein VG388_12670 [Solirubrobacteraceae bacterium]|jgi:hypothetical protein|nr:hypothetical protein [Solirubrobacteraceae bacterium]